MSKSGIILLADKAGCLNDFSVEFMPLPEFNAALQPLLQSHLECFVVLSGSDPLWESHLDDLGVEWGVCPDAHQGVDACTAFGVHCTQSWHGWVIDVAHTPTTPLELYAALASVVERYPLASALDQQGKRCFPIAFEGSLGCSLMVPANEILGKALDTPPSDAPMQWLNLAFAAPVPEPQHPVYPSSSEPASDV